MERELEKSGNESYKDKAYWKDRVGKVYFIYIKNFFPFKVFFWVSTVIQRITYTYVELELTTLLRSYEI